MKIYQIHFYTPTAYVESIKEAMFQTGAGKIENYEACAWQVLGQGQFRPTKGSSPFIGEQDKLEKVEEYRVEMVCLEEHLKDAIEAMKKAHPYEVVAYGVVELLELYSPIPLN